MEKEEEWRIFNQGPVNDHYVSNLGRIKSVTRFTGTEVINKTIITSSDGKVENEFRYKPGIKIFCGAKSVSVAKIVATIFVENPSRFKFIYHKDGNHLNSKASNLAWVSRNKSKPVLKVSMSGNVLAEFETSEQACIDWNITNGNDTLTPNLSPAVSKSIAGRYIARDYCYIPKSEILTEGLDSALKRRMKPVKPSKIIYMPSNAMKIHKYADRKANISYNDVFNIRISDNTEAELAQIYGVHPQLISEIRRNKCYKWAK